MCWHTNTVVAVSLDCARKTDSFSCVQLWLCKCACVCKCASEAMAVGVLVNV